MNSFKKAITLGTTVLALAFAANSAVAHGHGNGHGHKGHAKVWKDQGPSILVTADPTDFSYKMSLKYKLKNNVAAKPVAIEVDQSGVANALSQLKFAGQGDVLVIKELSFKDADGNKLEHCNMVRNPGFVAGAPSIAIAINKAGCIVQ